MEDLRQPFVVVSFIQVWEVELQGWEQPSK
jgi:hypothetical protein